MTDDRFTNTEADAAMFERQRGEADDAWLWDDLAAADAEEDALGVRRG